MLNQFYDYEGTLTARQKTELGIVYTPHWIVEWINNRALSLWDKPYPPRVIDPCCGTGIFLYDMANKISQRWSLELQEVYEKYVYGTDLDSNAVKIGNGLLRGAGLTVGNGLDVDLSHYDIVVTNPPYIRVHDLDLQTRDKIKKEYACCAKGDTDIYIAFIEKMVSSGCIVGFISPNTWIKNKYNLALRQLIQSSGRLETLIDFKSHKVFKGVGTYTSILVFDKKKVEEITTGKALCRLWMDKSKPSEVFFDGTVLPHKEDASFVADISSRNSIFDICDINVGLATLCDSVFLLELVEHQASTGYSLVKQTKKDSPVFKIETEVLINCIRGGDITKNADKRYVVVFPYDANNKVIDEDFFKTTYPQAFLYLAFHSDKLLARDKGKKVKYKWYEFGRSQAIKLIKKDKLVFAPFVKDKMVFKKSPEKTAFVGWCVVPKEGHTLEYVKETLSHPDVGKWISIFGKNLGQEWHALSKNVFKKYKINPKIS